MAAILEVKRLDTPLHYMEGRAYSQLGRDAVNKLFGAPPGSENARMRLRFGGSWFVRGVVTNGETWNVYDFGPGMAGLKGKDHTPICRFDLQTSPNVSALVGAIGRNHLLNRLGLSGG